MKFIDLAKLLILSAILVLFGCTNPTSSTSSGSPATATSLTPFIGVWNYSAVSGTIHISETATITATTFTLTGTLSGGSTGTLSTVGTLAATVSATSTTAIIVGQITSASATGDFSTTAVPGDYGRITLSLTGNTLTTNSDSANATSIAGAEASTITASPIVFTKSS